MSEIIEYSATDFETFIEKLSEAKIKLQKRRQNLIQHHKFLSDKDEEISSQSPAVFWFRGHGDAAWELRPTYDRKYFSRDPNNGSKGISEQMLEREYKDIFDSLPESLHPQSTIEIFSIAQHYGAPTRLLDMTKDVWTAIYFAFHKSSRFDTHRIIILDAQSLYENTWQLYKITDSYPQIPRLFLPPDQAKYKQTIDWGRAQLGDEQKLPIPIDVLPNSPRIANQHGAFIRFWDDKYKALEWWEVAQQHMAYINIPETARNTFCKYLDALCIDDFYIDGYNDIVSQNILNKIEQLKL